MGLKKILSVFLAAVMVFSAVSLGVTGAAAEIDYNAQYRLLAELLKDEHVSDLTNYKVKNTTLDNGNEGFDQEAKGFAYDHRVVAKDNENASILQASNRFYYIAESLMSTTYGVGCYDANTLVKHITERLKPYFASTSAVEGEILYESFAGGRYYPTEEELKKYDEAVSLIESVGGEVTRETLSEYGINFMVMDDWAYYNVEAILKYFVGNVLKVNTGNWYHRFSFIVETSVNDILEDCDGIDNIGQPTLAIRTAVYQYEYEKYYNETESKAYFAFKAPSVERVYENYGEEFDLNKTPDDLTRPTGMWPGILRDGQASAYMIKVTEDNETVPYLQAAALKFDEYVAKPYDAENNIKWDSQFVNWSDATIANHADTPVILGYAAQLSSMYSNDALVATFGNRLGNMVTLAYLFKTSRSAPTRTVRGTATYTATPDKINDIIYDLDALVSPNENETGDVKISNRVATVVSMFLDVGDLLGVETEIDYSTLEDLIGKVLSSLVFTDSIINMLVELLYPMIVDLLVDNLGGIDVIGGVAVDLVGDIIDNNGLAIYPNALAKLLRNSKYQSKYDIAAQILSNAGDNWENVNFDGLVWGVDDAPVDSKPDVFLDAACAALSGFTNLLVCFLCGNADYLNKNRQDISGAKFGKLYDVELVGGLAWLHSQGLYTKLFIPLYRVLGVPSNLYLSDKDFEAAVDRDTGNCLKEALRPILSWITECVAKKPFQTIMALLPNLVHFLSREGTVELSHEDDWAKPSFATDQEGSHEGFADLQTYNLLDILDHVYLSIVGSTLLFGANLYTTSIAGLIGDGTLGMLDSLGSLLNKIISFTYDTDEIYSENIACYSNNAGVIVLPDSTEYALNPSMYPNAHMVYYSDASNTQFSLTMDDAHPFEHRNITYVQKNFYIPAIPEQKLISCGDIDPATNTVVVNNPGLVFLFLLRYVMSALGYRYDLNDPTLPSLIECLGLDISGELMDGLSLADIINNVMLHPDEAICALLELFYSNETGYQVRYNKETGKYESKTYTYPIENINYHEKTLLNPVINPTLTYGADVKYSQYWTKESADDFVASLSPLAEDVLIMLGIEGMEDGLGAFLKNMLDENVFNNSLVNTLFNTIYQLIGSLNDTVGIDIEGILDAVLDVSFSPASIANALVKMIGHDSPASRAISEVNTWTELFYGGVEVDPVTGEETVIIQDVDLDWGIDDAEEHGHSRAESFLKTVAALLSPAAFVIKFLFMDEDLSILGLVNIPGYAGYQYAFIGLLEALSCPDILTYQDYYKESLDPDCGDANTIYYLFSPLLGLLEKVYADPLNTVLSLIPNLMFFISIGGLNDLVNNLIHFAYVLLDIVKPIFNAYDLLEGLLANINISGLSLNISIPLDIDFNALVSDLLGSLVGDVLTIEGVSLTLPYIDLYTLCVGTLQKFTSKEVRTTVYLNAAGGGELLTALLRIVFEVLFMEENHQALSQIITNLAGEGKLDEYDAETLYLVIDGLFGLLEENDVLDIVIYAVYLLLSKLVPVADMLAPRFAATGMTITDLIDATSDMDTFMDTLSLLLKDPEEVEVPGEVDDMGAIMSLFDRIKAFFEKIKLFFQNLFKF